MPEEMEHAREESVLDPDYSKPAQFGDVRLFSVYVPTGRCRSVDVIESMGWHRVNRRYHIRRPAGAQDPLILFTISGCGRVTIDGKTILVSAEKVCFIPADTPCEYMPEGESLWEFYWIHFSGRHALDMLEDILGEVGFCERFPVSSIRPLLERCLHTRFIALNGELFASIFLDQILSELLLDFCASGQDTDLVNKLIVYLGSDGVQNLSMDEVERRFHYSKEHIIRVFRKETNTTPYHYWREIKLAQSKQMLALSEQSVAQIAENSGYTSTESFVKQFKLRYGVTPNRYRKENRNAKTEEN